jgi:hypothetical protein
LMTDGENKWLRQWRVREYRCYGSVVPEYMPLYINAKAVVVTAVRMLSHSSEYDADGKFWARHMRKKIKMLLESAKA